MTSASLSLWNLRHLTSEGEKLGGGADTRSLCGRRVDWDLRVDPTPHHLENNVCKSCLETYRKEVKS